MGHKIWPATLIEKKKQSHRITALTAYDYATAAILDVAQIDLILVGDSVANVFEGKDSTLAVSVDQMIYHTQAVARACQHSLVVTDMPFLSYQVSLEQAKLNAGRILQEGQARAVKIETGIQDIPVVQALVQMGIPVLGHLGFTPQSVNQLGGYKVQGKTLDSAEMMCHLAQELEKAGAFGIVLELIPSQLAQKITQLVSIPTLGIGAGPYCDGQILVTQDVLGLSSGPSKKFVKPYVDLNAVISKAVSAYKYEVENGEFPSESHSF
jgi:3-methyl-2-oxobutanoate hydroxymethyltransferase